DGWATFGPDAALKLSVGPLGVDDGDVALLVLDMRQMFEAQAVDRVFGADLVKTLREDPAGPWADYHGKPITQYAVAKLLKHIHSPETIRIADRTARCYLRE